MLTSVCLLLLVASLHHDQVAAQQSYGAPASGYDSPAYSSPGADAGYAAPSDSYGGGYADYYDQGGYVATQEDGGLDLSKLTELLPLFIVVFAAIILAQLLSPLFLQLLGLLVGVLPMALSVKRPIIDAVLAPFGLQLCDLPGGGKRSFGDSFRSLSEEMSFSEGQIDILTDFVDRAIDAFSSMN